MIMELLKFSGAGFYASICIAIGDPISNDSRGRGFGFH
jgi:hypothetical protein